MLRGYKTADTELSVCRLDEQWRTVRTCSVEKFNITSFGKKCLLHHPPLTSKWSFQNTFNHYRSLRSLVVYSRTMKQLVKTYSYCLPENIMNKIQTYLKLYLSYVCEEWFRKFLALRPPYKMSLIVWKHFPKMISSFGLQRCISCRHISNKHKQEIQSDQKVSVHLMITIQKVKCTETIWSPCIMKV
jgi:hypothetical protein